jgi:hypothetical protein
MSKENKQVEPRDYWENHFLAWRASSLTRKAYCNQENINYPSFVYQLRANKIKNNQQQFIQINPHSINSNQGVGGLQIQLPNGVRIGMGNEVNIDLFQAVLKIARGI